MQIIKASIINNGENLDTVEKVYSINELPLTEIMLGCRDSKKGRVTYLELPAAFDIETTNIYKRTPEGKIDSEAFRPYAFMYHWQFCLGSFVVFGRTWKEFRILLKNLEERMNLSYLHRLVIYVHNLSFEFQFMKKFIRIIDGFYREEREPLKVVTDQGIEFRDSYALSNMNLSKFCENSGAFHYKLIDTFDYDKVRYPWTELTEEELAYCYNDVRGLSECIAVRMKEHTLADMPLTSTGYVRRLYRNSMRKNRRNRDIFLDSRLSAFLYEMHLQAFRGGDTHGNAYYAGEIIDNVFSFDIASSYPTELYTKEYPIGKYVHISAKRFLSGGTRKDFLHVLRVRMKNPRYVGTTGDPYLSINKMEKIKTIGKRIEDNGRLYALEGYIQFCCTCIDYDIITEEYTCSGLWISDIYASKKGMLPEEYRSVLIELFQNKTLLKGEESKEYEYNRSKEYINASFGMTVTRIDKDIIKYDQAEDIYIHEEKSLQEKIDQFYKGRNNFLPYQWGVFCTAYARKKLRDGMKGVVAAGGHVLYCDTDSIKFYGESGLKYFEEENKKLKKIAEELNASAVDSKGKIHYLGIWENEGKYKRFIHLGAKRYAIEKTIKDEKTEEKKDIVITTIAGVNKKRGAEFFTKKGIESFKNGVVIENSGHLVAYYNDQDITEENGIETASNLALVNDTYTLGVTGSYLELVNNLRNNILDVTYKS